LEVPLLGRPDWWALWYRGLGVPDAPLDSIRNNLSAEYLDVTQALAGHGIAIGSPILFRNEIDSGRLVPAHDLVATDGRAFWFTVPVARQDSRKIVQFREWLCEEASSAAAAAAPFIRSAQLSENRTHR
jgi:LysR family glycine cleavage system transcriptional activator